MKRRLTSTLAILVLGCLALAGAPTSAADRTLLLVTTTSVRDSGLLDALLPGFEERTGVKVQVVAVGSGAALRMGAGGNADVLLTHAPPGERKLVESGAAVSRTPFMENHFVIAGPESDPAKVGGAESPAEAIRRIVAAKAPFVSRGDDSGTHRREVALFEEAGLDPAAGWDGFDRTGSGMGLTLQVAGERRAYVLSDIGTFLAYRERIGLVALSKPAPSLRNVYSILQLDPAKLDPGRTEAAKALQAYLLEEATQTAIAEFGVERFGRPLFHPLADAGRGP